MYVFGVGPVGTVVITTRHDELGLFFKKLKLKVELNSVKILDSHIFDE